MVDEPSNEPNRDGSTSAARYLAAFSALVSFAIVTIGLGMRGFVGGRERDLLDRVDAAAGLPLDALDTSPLLPDALASILVSVFGAAWGLRLPGAIGVAFLVGSTCWLATRIWRDPWIGAVAGAITFSCPSLLYAARIAVPQFLGGCGVVATILFVYAASAADGPNNRATASPSRKKLAMFGGATASTAFSIACLGVILGGALPCLVSASLVRGRRPRVVLMISAALLAVFGAALAHHQGDGFIPALAASKNLKLMDQPSRRAISASLVEHLHGSFPWAPITLAGVLTLSTASAWIGLWWMAGIVVYSGWTAVYGPCPIALEVPMALSAAACLRAHMRTSNAPRAHGLLVVVVIATALVLMTDLSRTPYFALIPAYDRPRWIGEVDPFDLLARRSAWINWAMLGAFGLLVLIPRSMRPQLRRPVYGTWCMLAVLHGTLWVHGPLDHARTMRSLSPAIDRFTSLVDDGALTPALGTHRVFDRAMRVALRDRDVELLPFETRSKAVSWLHQDSPRALLVAASDVPALYAVADRERRPVYVLDQTHAQVWLVANVLPEGLEDLSPIPTVLATAPPGTGTPCSVQFKDSLELIEWEVFGEPRVGNTLKLRLVFRAQKRLPRSAKIVTRLKYGRISRIHERPEPFVRDIYPPNLWQHGDIIVHETDIELSSLIAFAGTHELIVTVYERDKQPLGARLRNGEAEPLQDLPEETVTPERDLADQASHGDPSEGMRIIGRKKEKVVLGQIEVLPRL